jgi:hypothetical protein
MFVLFFSGLNPAARAFKLRQRGTNIESLAHGFKFKFDFNSSKRGYKSKVAAATINFFSLDNYTFQLPSNPNGIHELLK